MEDTRENTSILAPKELPDSWGKQSTAAPPYP